MPQEDDFDVGAFPGPARVSGAGGGPEVEPACRQTSGAAALADEVAVPLRTLERWRLWWTEAFVVTPLWLAGCGAFMPPVDTGALPASLLERFVAADPSTRLIGLLRWLRPLTVRAAVPVATCPGDHAA